MKTIIEGFVIVFGMLLLSFFLGHLEPAYAQSLPYGMESMIYHPGYKKQIEYIQNHECNAIAIVPYTGNVFYECFSGEKFWSEILTPIPSIPTSSYVKNKSHQDDEDTASYSSSY